MTSEEILRGLREMLAGRYPAEVVDGVIEGLSARPKAEQEAVLLGELRREAREMLGAIVLSQAAGQVTEVVQ